MIIRYEMESDVEAIFKITKAAFQDHPYSNHPEPTEPFIINALRAAKALSISLVVEVDRKVVGHIAFSPVDISDGSHNWYGLGPISVLPAFQKKGVGKSLIHEGLALLKTLGAPGCVLVGDPKYYERFGFRSFPDLSVEGVPPENILALPFDNHIPQGEVIFHQAFSANS